jgi:hypothetical protein
MCGSWRKSFDPAWRDQDEKTKKLTLTCHMVLEYHMVLTRVPCMVSVDDLIDPENYNCQPTVEEPQLTRWRVSRLLLALMVSKGSVHTGPTGTVRREAMQALVRVQAHMLARIVVEIRAADIAVELEPQL